MHISCFDCKLRYPVVSIEIEKLVDNLHLKYAHLHILQVSFLIIKHCVKLSYIL